MFRGRRPPLIDCWVCAGGTPPLGCFDLVHSLRVLTNLLENALRHSPSHGYVELELEETTSDLAFRPSPRYEKLSSRRVYRRRRTC